MTAFWPGCGCCVCVETQLGSWSQDPTGEPLENDDAEILSVDEFDQIQSVQLYAEAAEIDRTQGYHARATFNQLLAGRSLPDVDMVSLFLDGGSHEVRLRYESFAAPFNWSAQCQYVTPTTILVQLWRGATKLGETRVAANIGAFGLAVNAVCGSLRGTEFCGGMNRGIDSGGPGGTVTEIDFARVVVETTETHNGGECWVAILDKGGRYHYREYHGGSIPQSQLIAVTSLTLTTCATHCPACDTCDDGGLDVSLSVVVPSYSQTFGHGTVSCGGGTFVLGNEGNCEWSHSSDNASIYMSFVTIAGTTRLQMTIQSCLDSGYCDGFVSVWTSDDISMYGMILCEDFVDIPLSVEYNGNTYTAYVSSV